MIPDLIRKMTDSPEKVVLWGDGSPTREFLYVDDAVEGLVLGALHYDGSAPVNLGTGQEIRVGDLAEKIISLIGTTARVEIDSARLRPPKSEVQRLVSDNRMAGELIAWQPEVPFTDGLRKTIAWIEDHTSLYTPDRYAI